MRIYLVYVVNNFIMFYRACMVPILLGSYSKTGAVIMSPLFFGIAHFHHMIERIRRGQDMKTAFFISSFQFAYTTVFGMYSAFLFVRTGKYFKFQHKIRFLYLFTILF